MEVGEAAEVEVVVDDEGVDKRRALIERKPECGMRRSKVAVEGLGEAGGESGFGGNGDKTSLLEIKKGFPVRVIVKGFDAEVTGDSEKESDREIGDVDGRTTGHWSVFDIVEERRHGLRFTESLV
jgi:hypothetical protein